MPVPNHHFQTYEGVYYMHEETSLAKIIDTVLQECGILHDESNKRMLHRSFEKLLEKIGTDKEFFKSGRKTFSFNKTDT